MTSSRAEGECDSVLKLIPVFVFVPGRSRYVHQSLQATVNIILLGELSFPV